ncbi:virion transmembrane glycoprotein [Porcine ephemerovirus 2]|uniref:Virion transmembrane glycoprotein n=1 Tax=Porcine ephemerovirus 2 TaxID=2928257 RepID=A0AAX3A6P5_9RHAB|nr:virion transmembrane glycoprotein [Porcine ephemerovirus 2]UNP42120.1 virion transmembrane glycoprotein [Porcine ephemerovirus 2]
MTFHRKSLIFVILWLIIRSDGFNYRGGFKIALLPVNCSNPINIRPEDVICPPRYNELDTNKIKDTDEVLTACRPKNKEDDHIKGKTCRVTTWRTTCTETWYFTTQIDYTIVEEEPGNVECILEYERLKKGNPAVPYYPPSVCYWNAVNTVKVKFVTVLDHPVLEDPYTLEVIDPLFNGQRCSYNDSFDGYRFCDTKSRFISWFAPKSEFRSSHCFIENWDCQTVKRSIGVDIDHHDFSKIHESEVWESPDIGRIGVYDACKMKFCGYWGVRLATGEWFNIRGRTNNVSLNTLVQRECEKNTTIGVRNHIDRTLFEELDVRLEFDHSQCIQTLIKLRNRERISPLELGYLNPSNEGKYFAYLVNYTTQPKIICTNKIEDVKDNQTKCTEGIFQQIGYRFEQPVMSIKRGLCEFKNVVLNSRNSADGGYYLENDTVISYARDKQSFKIKEFYDPEKPIHTEYTSYTHKYNLTWNGILVGRRTRNDTESDVRRKYYLPTFSPLDSLIPTIQSAKLEVTTIDLLRVKKLYIDENNQIWHLEDHQTLERVDVVEKVEEGVSKIFHTVSGWFSGAGKLIQWCLWTVGLLVVCWVLVRIYQVRRTKRQDKNKEFENPFKKFFSESKTKFPNRNQDVRIELEPIEPRKPRGKRTPKRDPYPDDGIYEDVNFKY